MFAPPTPTTPRGGRGAFIPLVSVVDFHHARGPEVERWFGVEDGHDPAAEYDWTLLPFMALSDGAHALTEDFSYFTLLRPATSTTDGDNNTNDVPATSLFGISCTRQMDASQLVNRPAEVTRSTVQKAVVVIADSPQYFGMLRERLSVVTKAWFAQREFTDVEILRRFQESLADEKARGMLQAEEEAERDQYLGLSLRELVREFRWQTLVLLKCCLLQPKMLFFGTRCERLCLTQFSLISLIPRLLHNLQDSAGPELDSYEKELTTPTSLRTSDRNSLLSYMGLPLQIFGKGSLFGPYTPLQQLDILADFGTKSYIVGSTNSLLLQQKDRYSDILINLDEDTINVTSPSLKAALQLSTPDRRWIDFITQNVNDTWDDANPSRPKTMGYVGSEEFIRVQFEEYLLSLISSVKYHAHLARHAHNPRMLLPDIEGDPSHDFGIEFVDAWARTENFRIWNSHTDSHLFDIVEPKHPCAGGLTIDDIQRRITQQVQDMHWDERFAQGREVLGRNLAAGREKASTLFGKLYADMEALREAQRRKAEESRQHHQHHHHHSSHPSDGSKSEHNEKTGMLGGTATGAAAAAPVDLAKAQQTVQTVGSKAGAFVNSWAAWAGEKRRAAWGGGGNSSSNTTNNNTSTTTTNTTTTASTSDTTSTARNSVSSGWSTSWVKSATGRNRSSQAYDALPSSSSRNNNNRPASIASTNDTLHDDDDHDDKTGEFERRPLHSSGHGSISGESMLDGVASDTAFSSPVASPRRVGRSGAGGGGSAVGHETVVSVGSVLPPVVEAEATPAAGEKTAAVSGNEKANHSESAEPNAAAATEKDNEKPTVLDIRRKNPDADTDTSAKAETEEEEKKEQEEKNSTQGASQSKSNLVSKSDDSDPEPSPHHTPDIATAEAAVVQGVWEKS